MSYIEDLNWQRDRQADDLANRGHTMRWTRDGKGPSARWLGECDECGAKITVEPMATSSWGSCDARTVDCEPGTWLLTEIEDARLIGLIGQAAQRFAEDTGLKKR